MKHLLCVFSLFFNVSIRMAVCLHWGIYDNFV